MAGEMKPTTQPYFRGAAARSLWRSLSDYGRRTPAVLDVSSREEIIQDIVDNSFGNSNDLRSLAFRLSTFSLAQLREKRRDNRL